ncbi:enoyl-CoA hydratase-related protein [Roseovarius sp. MMSF_3350]|uniref:enoyl-CoA hydratase-related protein n=1 Tax=Roseovarius sp. MMSF_3350 TaxID=3046706 RepID=UPI00273F0DE3|nr:enoyl-CoA hydratase-related protein [Roseovarius sp. MMSF_3350]
MSDQIITEIQGATGIVTLNRPERYNAISLEMWQRLPQAMQGLEQNPAVRTIILTGAGENYSSGADISEFDAVRATVQQAEDYEVVVDTCGDAIENLRKPTIAVINGFCLGGACHLAMACDFRFARHDASFAIPAARLSIVYGLSATRKLMSLVGLSNAKRILYSAHRFSAETGHTMGFIDEISTDPMETAHAFSAQIANNAPLSLSGTKLMLNSMAKGQQNIDTAITKEVISRAIMSHDYQEGRTAFLEKRSPQFTGK